MKKVMTQEDKNKLLLQDLCARLPYGVKCEAIDKNARFFIAGKYEYIEEVVKNIGTLNSKESTIDGDLFGLRNIQHSTQNKYYVSPVLWKIEDIKPYLRPMSSMTGEEMEKYHSYCECDDKDFTGEILYFDTIESFDYLNSIHVDYRGLIPLKLAIEVTQENNPYGKLK